MRYLRITTALCFIGVLVPAQQASADIDSVEVEYVAPFGTFGGRDYVYVEGVMEGTVGGGTTTHYRVPYLLIYPTSDPAGFGVVDTPLGTFFEIYPRTGACQTDLENIDPMGCANGSFMSPCETRGDFLCQNEGSLPLSDNRYEQQVYRPGRAFTEDFFFDQGYTYISVLNHRAITEHFGPNPPDGVRRRLSYGEIERAEDQYEILRDAGRFLRDPSTFNGGDLAGPAAVDHVVAYGYSNGAADLNTFLGTGENVEEGGSLVFDAFFIHSIGVLCHRNVDRKKFDDSKLGGVDRRGQSVAPTYVETFVCPLEFGWLVPPSMGAKVITLAHSTDMVSVNSAGLRRLYTADPEMLMNGDCTGPAGFGGDCPPDPNYLSYEIAGPAHIPTDVIDTSWMGTPSQNPADPRPVVRALFSHLHDWVVEDDASVMPESPMLEGTWVMDPTLPTFLQFTPVVDADGNFMGGIRLPFMQRYDESGDPLEAGAPLGTYIPINPEFLYVPVGATFPPISHLFPLVSGGYAPFDDLEERYPGNSYRDRVVAAAQMALDEGFILQVDYDRYVAGLGDVPDPDIPPDPEQKPPEFEEGCGCSADGIGRGGAANLLLLLSLLVLRRRGQVVRRKAQ